MLFRSTIVSPLFTKKLTSVIVNPLGPFSDFAGTLKIGVPSPEDETVVSLLPFMVTFLVILTLEIFSNE